MLDNRQIHIVEWRDLPYRWLSRQNPRNLAEWVSIIQAPIVTADARSSWGANVALTTR